MQFTFEKAARSAMLAAVIGSTCLALVGCGSSGSSSSDATSVATTSSGGAKSDAQSAADKVFAVYSNATVSWPGPTDPVRVAAGKRLTIITCGSTGITCVRLANGAKAAAQSIGYTATVVDGRQDPTVWNQAIHQAIANKSDGIVLAAVPPALVQGALQSAKAAGVEVAATLATHGDGPVTRVNYDRTKVAEANAAFIAKQSGGKAHVLQLADYTDFPDLKQDGEQYASLLTQYCSGCEVVKTLTFTAATAPQRLPGDVAQALQSDPSINYILVPFDTFNPFVIQGIRQAGKATSTKIVGVGGDPPSIDAIKSGTQVESLGTPAEWMGWSAVDGLLRAFAHQKQQPLLDSPGSNYDVPMRYVTSDNLPGSGSWQGDFDYEAQFKKVWRK